MGDGALVGVQDQGEGGGEIRVGWSSIFFINQFVAKYDFEHVVTIGEK